MTKYDDGPVKAMLYPAMIFMVLGMTLGVFIAFNGLVFPDYFAGEYVHFGRIRPVHVSTVLYLWLISANIGLFYFFVPRLAGVSIWSPKVAYIGAVFWWAGLIIGIYSLPTGTNFGWEYAEIPHFVGWIPVKFMITAAIILLGVNVFMTVAIRKNEKLYVSLWYAMGTVVWALFTWIAGTYVINFVPGGISRVNISFFYVHNLVGLIFTPMGLAIIYYFLPKISNAPIYSHRLSMIGFWSIAFVYAWIGAHHIIHGPISQWLQTVSIIFSIWLFIPVWTVVTNLFMTLKNDWSAYLESVPIRFLIMGTMFYLLTCIQGPLMAVRNINEITSKTDWVIGHSHISLYATFTFFALAGFYYVIPAITGKALWSEKLANLHFSLNMLGSIPFLAALWVGGFWQGLLWSSWANGNTYAEFHNNLTLLPFLDTVADMRIFWIWRGIGGIIILIANLIFVINMLNTIILKDEVNELSTLKRQSA